MYNKQSSSIKSLTIFQELLKRQIVFNNLIGKYEKRSLDKKNSKYQINEIRIFTIYKRKALTLEYFLSSVKGCPLTQSVKLILGQCTTLTDLNVILLKQVGIKFVWKKFQKLYEFIFQ